MAKQNRPVHVADHNRAHNPGTHPLYILSTWFELESPVY